MLKKGLEKILSAEGCRGLGEEVCWLRASPVKCDPPVKIFVPDAIVRETSGQETALDHQVAQVRRALIYMPTNAETCKITTKGAFLVRKRCGPFGCPIEEIENPEQWNITGWKIRNRCVLAIRVIQPKTVDWSNQTQRAVWSPAAPGLV